MTSTRCFDARGERRTRNGEADHLHVERRRRILVEGTTERRETTAGRVEHFERPHDAAAVAGLDARRGIGIHGSQSCVRVCHSCGCPGGNHELLPYREVLPGDLERVDDRAHVQPGATDEQGPLPARLDVGDRARASACVRTTDHSSDGSATSTR